MTDETAAPEEGAVTEGEISLSPLEQDAVSRGWMPVDQWVEQGRSEDEWVDAKSFVERGKFMDVISKQSKKLKKAEKAIEDLKSLYQTVKEKTAAEVRDQLLAEKAIHLENGDFKKAVEVDKQLLEAATEPAKASDKKGSADVYVEYFEEKWIDKNPWYHESVLMADTADKLGARYIQNNPDADPSELFEYVDKQIRKEFPEKFGKVTARQPSAGRVEASTRNGKSNTTSKSVRDRLNNLSEDERKVGKRFVETGVFKSLDEYAADLVKHGL